MNKRIRELEKQATKTVKCGLNGTYTAEVFNRKKFAELIVKECLDIALEVRRQPASDTHYVIGYDRACEKMIVGIKDHFGVE